MSSRDTTPSFAQQESLFLPEGTVSEEATELLQDFVRGDPGHEHHSHADTLFPKSSARERRPDEEEVRKDRQSKPWYRRPSPIWLLLTTPFSAIAGSAALAPRVEILTVLACSVHKPEYVAHVDLSYLGIPYHPIGEIPPIPGTPPLVYNLSFSGREDTVRQCAANPTVQAAVARLTTVMATIMGILAFSTTAWWGSLSDRKGRTFVMSVSVLGLVFNDFVFLYVVKSNVNYWVLVIGPIIEGVLGGYTTGVAANHAYMADTVAPEARSRIFSLALGLMFIGFSGGPIVGALVIGITGSTLSVFYMAALVHSLYALFATFVLPESLTLKGMAVSRNLHRETVSGTTQRSAGAWARSKAFFIAFVSPLALFLPARVTSPSGRQHRDWNLTAMAAAYAFVGTLLGSYSFKLQYAAGTFGWTSKEMGYFLSTITISRAAYLTLILPVIIKLAQWKRKPAAVALAVDADEPLYVTNPNSTPVAQPPAKTSAHPHSPAFDLGLAQVSLFIEVVSFTAIALATKPIVFGALSVAASFGGGASPAMQSLALELFAARGGTETGKLFGALSVVQTLSSGVIGPSVFGFLYYQTVAFFPSAIFFLSAMFITCAFVMMCLVRIPKDFNKTPVAADVEGEVGKLTREAPLVEVVDADSESSSSGSTRRV